MKCAYCEKKITIAFSKKRKFCSDKCKNAYFYSKSKKKPRFCKVCGKKINEPRRQFCSDECRQKANQDKATEIRSTYKKIKITERKRTKPALSIAQINELARAEGLNYGQYCAKYKL